MPDENNPKVSGEGESVELPTPQFSSQATSSPSADADAIVSKLTPILEQLVEKKVQSTKDKRISKLEKALGGRLDLLAELEEEGVTVPKDLRMQMQIRDLEERLTPQPAQPAPPVDAGTSQKQAVVEAIAELNKYNLSSNDPAFLDLLRGQYPSKEAFDAKVQRYILGKVAPQQPPSPADLVQSPSAAGSTGKNVQAKIVRLQALQREPTKNRAEIKQLTEELDAVNWGG